jgi:hypothetical protein
MIRVEESVEINRPVEKVFSYTSTPKNFPQWAATVIEVRHEDAPGGDYPLGREPVSSDGTRFTARIEAEPGGFFGLVGVVVLERAIRRQMSTNLETLKDLLEARGSCRKVNTCQGMFLAASLYGRVGSR